MTEKTLLLNSVIFFFCFQKKQIRPLKLRDSSVLGSIFDDLIAFRGRIRPEDASKMQIHVTMSARLQLHSCYGNTRWHALQRQWLILYDDGRHFCFWRHFRLFRCIPRQNRSAGPQRCKVVSPLPILVEPKKFNPFLLVLG